MSSLRTAAALAVLLAASAASAQVVKCRGADGRVTYSDGPCAAGAPGQAVNVQGNVLNGAADRRAADEYRLKSAVESREREINGMMMNAPAQCKFSYFAVGDKKGQELAKLAKRECVENIIAEREGRPTSMRYYQMWNDHHSRTGSDRQQAANRAAAIANQPMRPATPPSYNCRKNYTGSVDCSPQ